MTKNSVFVEFAESSLTFAKLPDGTFYPPHGNTSTLVKNIDNTFALTFPQPEVMEFNEDGNLTSWQFPYGVIITLTYDTGKLATVDNEMCIYRCSGLRLSEYADIHRLQ